MPQFRKKALTRLAVFSLGTSALAATPGLAQVIDYPIGTNNSSPIVLANNSTLLQVLTGSATQSGVISGSFGLEKIGTGTLIFSGNNSYTGGTTISAGTLQLGDGSIGGIGKVGFGNVVNNGTLAANLGLVSSVLLDNVISGSGNLTKTGAGLLTLGGNNTYSGTTTITGGTILVGNGASGTLGSGDVVNNGALAFNRSNTFTLANNISGTGGITDNGFGLLIITGTNSYSGQTVSNGGSIQIGAGGTSGSLGTGDVVLGGLANLTFNRSDTLIYSGAISGIGSVTQAGSGTTILTGASTYTGGTTINAGSTLQVGNGGTSGLLPGLTASPFWVANSGTLIFNRSDTSIFHNIVNGSGAILKQGAGTLIVTGSLNASNITISQGALQFGNGAEDGGFNASVTNNAVLVFGYNANFISHIGNVISGSGSVSLVGGGGVIYDAAQAYTGGTTISAGLLQLGVGGALPSVGAVTVNGGIFDLNGHAQTVGALSGSSGSINLGSGNLTTNTNASTTLAAGISGSGTLTKQGAGSLTLSGSNTYTGATTVSTGTLSVAGSISSSAVTVQNGATLAGTGTVGSTTIASGGTLAPGNSIGTLTVNGNLTLAAGSVYNVEVSPSAADRTMVSGKASLNGTVATGVAPGAYTFGQRFTLLTATGGVSGTFASLTGIPAYLKGGLSYDTNNAYLTLSPNTLAPLLSNASANQGKVVAAIDAAVTSGGTPGAGFQTLYGLSGAALNSALDQISGQVGPNTINAVGQGTLSFLTMTAQGGSNSGSFAPGSAYGGADAPHRAQLGAGETRVWGAAYGGHVGLSADAASGAASLSSSNVGLIGGADMAWDDGWLAGVTAGLGQQNFSSGNGTGSSDDIMIGVYARKDAGPLYVSAAFGYGAHHIESLRVITVSGTDVLQGKQNADDYGGRIEAGWRMALDDKFTLTPYFAIAAESFETPAYAESALSGASTFALSFAAHSSALGRTELGSTVSRNYETENGVLTADLRGGWAHQLDDLPFTQASFQSLPGASFLVTGVRPANDTALLGADIQIQNRSGLFFGFRSETQLGAGTTIVEGMGNLGWRW